ncbi:GDP-mannose mannosyl hydrolase [Colwellia demingiae]|uniref:GDP-mannose mannosyl hydrolase n=1 Tax=Colwellia demingiae TaxID=89401 RepID=A0A5C6QTC2_9GAMM|nr:GDP-mannose mannosyl hydrolase [Colwellia demingiae]TWX71942.1 GDP-mannose mannosyl hydrolase [Colwellia demingiae]
MLPLATFKTVIASTPLISIDLVVKNSEGQILLGKRTNRPAQHYWFVPGGRVLKDEPLEIAFSRILKAELSSDKREAKFLGVYQHFYEDNVTVDKFTTHYIVLAYELFFNESVMKLPTEQHNEYQWFNKSELLNHDAVHKHTKWYFQKGKKAGEAFSL